MCSGKIIRDSPTRRTGDRIRPAWAARKTPGILPAIARNGRRYFRGKVDPIVVGVKTSAPARVTRRAARRTRPGPLPRGAGTIPRPWAASSGRSNPTLRAEIPWPRGLAPAYTPGCRLRTRIRFVSGWKSSTHRSVMTRCGPVLGRQPRRLARARAGQVAGRRQEVELLDELLRVVLHHDQRPPAERRQVVRPAAARAAAPSASS